MPLATCRHFIDDRDVRNIAKSIPELLDKHAMWHEWNTDHICRLRNLKGMRRNSTRSANGSMSNGRHASRLRMPYDDYCRSCQELEEEEAIKHLLCECNDLYRKRITILGRGFFDDVLATDETFRIDELQQKRGVIQKGDNRVREFQFRWYPT